MKFYAQLLSLAALLSCTFSYASVPPPWQAPLLQNHLLVGKIYAPTLKQWLTPSELVLSLKKAERVLMGEQHDNQDHHQLQQWLLQQLKPSTLVLEMLTQDQQPSHLLPANSHADTLQAALNWNDKGWPWALYGPVITTAVNQATELVAGNINRETVSAIAMGQQQVEHTLPSTTTDWLLEQVFSGHCGLMPKQHLQPMVAVQIARDQAMAKALTEAEPPAILLAGGVHVDKRYAVPAHMKGNPITLLLLEVAEDKPALEHYQISPEQADFVWFTPKQSDEDKCAALEAKLKASHATKAKAAN